MTNNNTHRKYSTKSNNDYHKQQQQQQQQSKPLSVRKNICSNTSTTSSSTANTSSGSSSISRYVVVVLLRTPCIWVLGISFVLSTSILIWDYLCNNIPKLLLSLSSSLSSSSSSIHLIAFMTPIFIGSMFSIILLWTILCSILFVKDVYNNIIRFNPIFNLQPYIQKADQYSIDDILSVLCDPSQLLSYVVGTWIVPITLYTIPTTSQQRAQIISSIFQSNTNNTIIQTNDNNNNQSIEQSDDTGLLASRSKAPSEIFTEPGGWKYLLPQSIQSILINIIDDKESNNNKSENDNNNKINIMKDGMIDDDLVHYHDIVNEDHSDNVVLIIDSIDNDEASNDTSQHEQEQELLEPKKQQLYQDRYVDASKTFATKFPSVDNNNTNNDPTSIKSDGYSQEQNNVSDVFVKILIDCMNHKFQHVIKYLQKEQPTIAITAISTCIILLLQIRNSHTARSIIKVISHMILTTTTSVTLAASLIALITPYLYQQLQQQEQHKGIYIPHNINEIKSWTTWFATILANTTRSISTRKLMLMMMNTIPKSIHLPKTIISKHMIHHLLSKWKGTIVVLVLSYWQYRHRQHIQQHQRRA